MGKTGERGLTKAQAKELQQHLEAIDNAKLDIVNRAVVIGEHLTAVKEMLPHGHFQDWLDENCGLSKSTAQNYMSAWDAFGKYPKIGYLDASAIYCLARCEPAVEEAKALCNKGFRISETKAKELVEKHKTKPPKPRTSDPGPQRAAPASVARINAQVNQAREELAETGDGSAAPEPDPIDDSAGGYEPSEAAKPLDKLKAALGQAARAHADATKILGAPDGLREIFEHIDAASIALDRFQKRFKRKPK